MECPRLFGLGQYNQSRPLACRQHGNHAGGPAIVGLRPSGTVDTFDIDADFEAHRDGHDGHVRCVSQVEPQIHRRRSGRKRRLAERVVDQSNFARRGVRSLPEQASQADPGCDVASRQVMGDKARSPTAFVCGQFVRRVEVGRPEIQYSQFDPGARRVGCIGVPGQNCHHVPGNNARLRR